MENIFTAFLKPNLYGVKEASDEQILLYKKAYKVFKEKNKETKATLKLDLDTSTIIFENFEGLDMYNFGYEVAKAE